MKKEFSPQERAFIVRIKGSNSKIRIALILVIGLILFGLLLDAFEGFYILRNAKSWIWGIVGLIILSLFYGIGEAVAEWIGSKDDVSHPLYKRVLHLLMLLLFAGIVMVACGFMFKWLGW